MFDNPLGSAAKYSRFVAALLNRSDTIRYPNDPTLATTHPHHKHVPPDIKRNRVPAPGLSFTKPNLPQIIEEIEKLVVRRKAAKPQK